MSAHGKFGRWLMVGGGALMAFGGALWLCELFERSSGGLVSEQTGVRAWTFIFAALVSLAVAWLAARRRPLPH
jgi:hypothetical protein